MPELTIIEGSHNVHSAGYDEPTNVLSVRFWRRPKGADPVPGAVLYNYTGVEPEVAQGFFDAKSKSRYLDDLIKPAYQFVRVDLTQQEGETP